MEFLPEALDKYIVEHSDYESELLKELNRDTHLNVLQPRMLSGHFQGRVLSMFSKMIQPKNILEIGTYTGYSAICLAEGLQKEGKLITIDVNEELESMVAKYIAEAKFQNIIQPIIGDATEIIPTLKEEFDIVFIDADKKNYSNYFDLVFPKVRQGGFIIADNVLWSGKVLQEDDKLDKSTQAIVSYNSKIKQDKRVENVVFPVRDGLSVARKIA